MNLRKGKKVTGMKYKTPWTWPIKRASNPCLSLSSYDFIGILADGTLYMSALLVALRGFWLPFTHAISTA